jgi:hypothetical protein
MPCNRQAEHMFCCSCKPPSAHKHSLTTLHVRWIYPAPQPIWPLFKRRLGVLFADAYLCAATCAAVDGVPTPGKRVTFEVTLPNGQKVTRSCTTGTRRNAARQTSAGTCSVTVNSPVTGDVVSTATVPGNSGTVTSTSPGPDGAPTGGQSSTVQVVGPSVEKLTVTGGPAIVPVNGQATLTGTYTSEQEHKLLFGKDRSQSCHCCCTAAAAVV